MAINFGQLDFDPTQMWFGNNPLKEVWAGDEKVWPTDVLLAMGPEVYLTFENSLADNQGSLILTGPYNINGGGVLKLGTAEYRGLAGNRFTNYQSSWTNGGTLMCWARTVSVRTSGTLDIIQRNSPSGTMNELYIVEDSATNRYFAGCTTGGQWFDAASPDLGGEKDRQWHHLAVSVTALSGGTAAYLSLFVDGEFVGSSGVRNVPTVNFDASTELYLAQSRLYNTWTGNLDNVATFDRPLLDNEIRAIYEAQKPTMPFIPTIITLVLPDMRQGVAFSMQLAANFTATSWTAVGVPPGLTLNSTTGVLSGTPSMITSGTMTVVANGANDQTAEMTYSWMVEANLVNLSVGFVDDAEMFENFPLRGFDGRTSASSPRNPGWVWNGMLVAGDNNYATYWNLLAEQPIKGDAEWVLRTGDVVSSSNPLGLVISSSSSFTNQIILEITNDNIRLVRRTTAGITSIKSYNTRDAGPWSDVRVVRSGTNVSVYASGNLKFTQSLASYDYWNLSNNGYFGINMYSASGQWCGRVDSFTVNQTS